MCIRILLSIEHNLYRDALKNILNGYDDLSVYEDKKFLENESSLYDKADVIVTDTKNKNEEAMSIMSKFIKKDNKGIVVLIAEKDTDILNKVILSDIYTGIVSLSSDIDVLVKGIYNANDNIKFIDEAFNEIYVKSDITQFDEENQLLTKRELEVLKLVAQGCFNKEIASKMGITERTVKNYVSGIFKKIDVCDRTQAAIYAIKNNIVNL